jgi:predicted nucleotidyltransferase
MPPLSSEPQGGGNFQYTSFSLERMGRHHNEGAQTNRYNQCMNSEINSIMSILKELLPVLSDRYKVEELGVFGSYLRQEQSADSDLDILVTFSEPPSLLKFIEMENYLSDVLGVKVDLVMKDALKQAIGQQILKEVIQV